MKWISIIQKTVTENNYEHSISLLHARLWLKRNVNISYRTQFAKCQIKLEEEKEMEFVKDVLKTEVWNSNDGNIERKFFKDPELTSGITSVNVQLIKRYIIILH